MNDNLSSMITPKNFAKNNLSRVMPLRSKGVMRDNVILCSHKRRNTSLVTFEFPSNIIQCVVCLIC